MPRHIRKGDTVVVTAGNDKGVTGEVLQVLPKRDRVLVKGVNIRVKHMRKSEQYQQGAIIEREMPIHISNVSPLIDDKPSRVRFESDENKVKKRIAVRNGEELHTLKGNR